MANQYWLPVCPPPVKGSLGFALGQKKVTEVSAFSLKSTGRRFSDQKLKTEIRIDEQVEKPPLCLCTLLGVLVLLLLIYNCVKQEFLIFCMRKPRPSETD